MKTWQSWVLFALVVLAVPFLWWVAPAPLPHSFTPQCWVEIDGEQPLGVKEVLVVGGRPTVCLIFHRGNQQEMVVCKTMYPADCQ